MSDRDPVKVVWGGIEWIYGEVHCDFGEGTLNWDLAANYAGMGVFSLLVLPFTGELSLVIKALLWRGRGDKKGKQKLRGG